MLAVLWSLPLFVLGAACTKVTHHEFNVTWVNRNPDGRRDRPVMGINGQWPIPVLRVIKGERVVITVRNQLGNETTSLHWHGLYMNGTAYMDGPPGVTQCEIPYGDSFIYDFTVCCRTSLEASLHRLMAIGRPARDVLVSFAHPWTVS